MTNPLNVISAVMAPEDMDRPDSVSLIDLAEHYSADPGSLNIFLGNLEQLESQGYGNVEQEGNTGEVRGSGIYQWETGDREGAYTRFKRAYRELPTELTPRWMHEMNENLNDEGRLSINASKELSPDQQRLIQAVTVLSPGAKGGGREYFDQWSQGDTNTQMIEYDYLIN